MICTIFTMPTLENYFALTKSNMRYYYATLLIIKSILHHQDLLSSKSPRIHWFIII